MPYTRKNRFLLIGNTLFVCERMRVVAYTVHHSANDGCNVLGMKQKPLKTKFFISLPSELSTSSSCFPAAVLQSPDESNVAHVFWECGFLQVIDIDTGLTVASYEIALRDCDSYIFAVQIWQVGTFLITELSHSGEHISAFTWTTKEEKQYTWDKLPSHELELLYESDDRGQKMKEPVAPVGLVCVSKDLKKIELCSLHAKDRLRPTVKLPIQSQATLASIRAHPNQRGTYAVTDSNGFLFIVKNLCDNNFETETRYSSKRWHSKTIRALQWLNDEHGVESNTIYTGGEEAVLCAWSASTLDHASFPRFCSPIVDIIVDVARPAQIFVVLEDEKLVQIDITKREIASEHISISSSTDSSDFTRMKRIHLHNETYLCMFGSTKSGLRIMHHRSRELLCQITPRHHASPAQASQSGKSGIASTVFGIEAIHHQAYDHIAALELNQCAEPTSFISTTLRFYRVNADKSAMILSTTIHEPHALDTASTFGAELMRPPIFISAHPQEPLFFTGVQTECKLWRLEHHEVAQGDLEYNWLCHAVFFQGANAASFTRDGTVLGIVRPTSHLITLFDANVLMKNHALVPLHDLNFDAVLDAPLRDLCFACDDRAALVVSGGREIHAFSVRDAVAHSVRMLDDKRRASAIFIKDGENMAFVDPSGLRIFSLRNSNEAVKGEGGLGLKVGCDFSIEWPDFHHFSVVKGAEIVFDTESKGVLYALRQCVKSKQTHLVTYAIDMEARELTTENATKRPACTNASSMHKEKQGENMLFRLAQAENLKCSKNTLLSADKIHRLDVTGSLSTVSYKMPPLNVVCQKLFVR